MVPRYARADRTVRGSHGRPAMDSPRSGADKHRITLRHDNRSRVSNAVFDQLPRERVDSDPKWCATSGELRVESCALPCCRAGRFQDSRTRVGADFERTS